jgi:hypothetical protein
MTSAFHSREQQPMDVDLNGASGDFLRSFGYTHKNQGWSA